MLIGRMFNFTGFIKSLGLGILVLIAVSFLIGLTGIENIPFIFTVLYTLCYVLIGVFAPLWNPDVPYTASYLASITLTILNFLFAFFILDILVFAEPSSINAGLVRNSLVSILVTYAVIKISKRKQETPR